MSKADVLFVNMCNQILNNGFSSQGQEVRARWEDGSPAHTIKSFGVVNRYNLQEDMEEEPGTAAASETAEAADAPSAPAPPTVPPSAHCSIRSF